MSIVTTIFFIFISWIKEVPCFNCEYPLGRGHHKVISHTLKNNIYFSSTVQFHRGIFIQKNRCPAKHTSCVPCKTTVFTSVSISLILYSWIYFPRSSFTSSRVMDLSSFSIASCTLLSLSSRTLWMFRPTGHLGFGFS